MIQRITSQKAVILWGYHYLSLLTFVFVLHSLRALFAAFLTPSFSSLASVFKVFDGVFPFIAIAYQTHQFLSCARIESNSDGVFSLYATALRTSQSLSVASFVNTSNGALML